ncbi:MAG: hypothetical protein Q7T30_00580 [Planctomycetota bacterium]|nr:hypothetical protein [Planctomycetota bacterium]
MNLIACKTVALTALSALVALGAATAQDPKPVPAQPAALLQPAPQGQQKSQEELIKLRDEKLALPVFTKADWTFDYDKARERAAKEGKLIFAYFSRSYAH